MQKKINSLQNPFLKQLIHLHEKSRERKKTGLFLIEGEREIGLAIKGGYAIEAFIFCKELYPENMLIHLLNQPVDQIEVSLEIYQKLAYRETTEGIIALAKAKNLSLQSLLFTTKNPIILVAEAPEKPGNIGALLRTADAAKLDAVLIANPKTDLYNPNIIRSSVGGLFTNQIATGTTEEIISFLKKNNIAIYCAALKASIPYTETNFSKACAIVVGTESTGLSAPWLENATQNIIIPMEGEIDSMNVSVAAAILIFEAKRQQKHL
ncbi:MAG: rRNA methyltransferase [Bacteroidetes bacterium HGW-Bacteroidetes-2]|jgi:TrmH family RNA methyltransferase|nr:MAG: rRNA methyltransferase [Bacteroidetes bacterium HGW-Bacteroidetes-2]